MVTQAATANVLLSWWKGRKKRRPAWLWRSYLDLCISTQQKYGGIVDNLENCAHIWRSDEADGEVVGMRPVGCGDRLRCPLCADYYHGTLAREGVAVIEALLGAADAKGISRDTWGDAIEFTLPKDVSGQLDALLEFNADIARDKINKLRQAAWRCVKRAVKKACQDAGVDLPGELGAVMIVHHWGSSIPWQPHWHIHIYLSPLTVTDCVSSEVRDGDDVLECGLKRHSCHGCPWSGRDGSGKGDNTRCFKLGCELEVVRVIHDGRQGETVKLIKPKAQKSHRVYSNEFSNWCSLPRWWSTEALGELRASWKKAAERILGVKYPGDWDAHRGYLSGEPQMIHNVAYQMRAPMKDIWQGVRSVCDAAGEVVPGVFNYRVKKRGKKGKPGYCPAKLMPMTVDDFEAAYGRADRVQTWLTRITWYGYLSNTKQAAAMRSLDLEAEEDEVKGQGKGRYWRPVDTTAVGVFFEASDGGEDVVFVDWAMLHSEPVPEPAEKPIGATRRRRWVLNKGSP